MKQIDHEDPEEVFVRNYSSIDYFDDFLWSHREGE